MGFVAVFVLKLGVLNSRQDISQTEPSCARFELNEASKYRIYRPLASITDSLPLFSPPALSQLSKKVRIKAPLTYPI
jgi:hypothetical protein